MGRLREALIEAKRVLTPEDFPFSSESTFEEATRFTASLFSGSPSYLRSSLFLNTEGLLLTRSLELNFAKFRHECVFMPDSSLGSNMLTCIATSGMRAFSIREWYFLLWNGLRQAGGTPLQCRISYSYSSSSRDSCGFLQLWEACFGTSKSKMSPESKGCCLK